jgi:bacteriorhodopsin
VVCPERVVLSRVVWGRLVWLFSEGFASFSVSFEVCAYAVLDIVAKAIFGFMVMAAHDQLGAASASSQEYV